MYVPYMEQSILIILYDAFAVVLVGLNWKRKVIAVRVTWGMMCAIITFLMLTGVLEAGQANFNKITGECFLVHYQGLY